MTETQERGRGAATGASDRRDVLARIVASKRNEVEALRPREAELRERARGANPPRDFASALRRPGSVSLIAEVKRRSPGAGAIDTGLDPAVQARRYHEGGAGAISVLTDREWFQGSLEDLAAVREAVPLPALRKDFTLDAAQVWEARAAGADAVLLIVRILDDARLRELRLLAEELGMAALVETHDASEIERAVASGAGIIGINNRDLRTFTTRIEVTLDLLDHVPRDVTLVSESGIRERAQVERLARAGVDAILVGEALVRAGDPVRAAQELASVPRASRSARRE